MNPPPALARVRRAHLAWAGGALALVVAAGAAQAVTSGHGSAADRGAPRIVAAAATAPASGPPSARPSASRRAVPPPIPGKGRRPGALCLQLDPAAVRAVAAAASGTPATKGAKGSVAAPSGTDGAVALALTATRLVPCPAGVTAPKPTFPTWKKHAPGSKRTGAPVRPTVPTVRPSAS